MKNETQLFIRACKRDDSAKRCEAILRRFFLLNKFGETEQQKKEYENDVLNASIIHLTDIVDTYCPMKSIDIISELTANSPFHKDNLTPKEKALNMLINRIRHTGKDSFTGLSTPAWLKNRYKNKLS